MQNSKNRSYRYNESWWYIHEKIQDEKCQENGQKMFYKMLEMIKKCTDQVIRNWK